MQLTAHAWRQGERRVYGDHRALIDETIKVVHEHAVAKGPRRRISRSSSSMLPLHPGLFQHVGVVLRPLEPSDRSGFASTPAQADPNESVERPSRLLRRPAHCSESSTDGMCCPKKRR